MPSGPGVELKSVEEDIKTVDDIVLNWIKNFWGTFQKNWITFWIILFLVNADVFSQIIRKILTLKLWQLK